MRSKDAVTTRMESLLSKPPSKVGLRLKSEVDLAHSFKIGRWQIRKSLEDLAEKGILVKKRGSGTYVRKIPEFQMDSDINRSLSFEYISPEDLFTDPNVADNPAPLQLSTASGLSLQASSEHAHLNQNMQK